MDVGARLQRMLDAGVELRADGDRLAIKAPAPLTDEQRSWVRENKAELLALLRVITGPDLHGWELDQIQAHCHPSEWAEIKNNPAALEAVAADLRRHPFLFSGDTRGDVDVLVRCADCAWFGRSKGHPFLGSCSRGQPEGVAGLWASTWRSCDVYEPCQEAADRGGQP